MGFTSMSTTSGTLASNRPSELPAPSNSCGHTLIFYEDDSALLDGLSQSICTAICTGNSVLVVATAAHHDGLVTYLRDRCANTHTAIIEGRLFLLDADEILSKIMVDGQLDPDRAITVIGNYIEMLTAAARGEDPKVFAFGELVCPPLGAGKPNRSLHLELLCRQLVEVRPLATLLRLPHAPLSHRHRPHPHPREFQLPPKPGAFYSRQSPSCITHPCKPLRIQILYKFFFKNTQQNRMSSPPTPPKTRNPINLNKIKLSPKRFLVMVNPVQLNSEIRKAPATAGAFFVPQTSYRQ